MKGLFLKDLYLSRQLSKVIFLIVIISIIMLIGDPSNIEFINGYITIVFSTFAISTLSYDDQNNGIAFLMTLPIRRRDFVYEKYIFGAMVIATGWIFSLLLGIIFSVTAKIPVNYTEFISSGLIMLFLGILSLSASLPIQFRFGAEKGRIMMVIFFASLFIIIIALVKLSLLLNASAIINRLFTGPNFYLSGFFLTALILFISIRASLHIIEKKEY